MKEPLILKAFQLQGRMMQLTFVFEYVVEELIKLMEETADFTSEIEKGNCTQAEKNTIRELSRQLQASVDKMALGQATRKRQEKNSDG